MLIVFYVKAAVFQVIGIRHIVADPYLQMGGGGGRGKPGHPDPEIGGRRSQKNFFGPFGPQFGLKIRRGRPPGPLFGSATGIYCLDLKRFHLLALIKCK